MTKEANVVAPSDNQEPAQQADTSQNVTPPTTDTSKPDTKFDTTPAPAQKETGILDGKTEPEKPVQPDWREDWLDKIAGDDEKVKNQLSKYASPKAVAEALIAAQKKISTYKPEVTLPEKPTDEDIAKYRKAYGIPEKPEGYDIKLENGIVLGEVDKPLLDKFKEKMHAMHAKPEEVKRAVQAHFENLQAENEAITARMTEQKTKAEDELRGEWGDKFRQNANVINNFLHNKFGEEVAQSLLSAVLSDGTVLQNNPKVLRSLLTIANDIDPIATIGGSSGTSAQSIDEEIKSLEHIIATDPDKYWNDQRKVDRYAELKNVKQRLSNS